MQQDAEPLENIKGHVRYENVSFHYSDDDYTRYLPMFLLKSRQENRLRWSDHPEVERQPSVLCFRDFMM